MDEKCRLDKKLTPSMVYLIIQKKKNLLIPPSFKQEEAEPVNSLPDWMKEIHVADDEVLPFDDSDHNEIRLDHGSGLENPYS